MRTAILLGVSHYDGLEDLRSPQADTAQIEKALKANGHFDRVVVRSDPGRTEAMEVVEEALDAGKPRDLLFISFSGHGLTVALWSGIQAAAAAHAWLIGNAEPLRAYQAAVATGRRRFVTDAERHYRAEQRFRDRPFWSRRHAAGK